MKGALDQELTELARAVRGRKRRALAKAITLVESTHPEHELRAQSLLELLLPHTGNAIRVGITGVPGVGKSTFIDAWGSHLLERGFRVAVLAVDPSSVVSGGSLLGDKTRMSRLAVAPDAFIRPSPSRGALGGVARHTREAMLVCEAAGYDVVLVETVGVGQSELAVADMVDVFLLLMLANAGDELQGLKRGIFEVADTVAINKADGDNVAAALRAQGEYAAALRLLRARDIPPVLTCSALESQGLAEIWDAVSARHQTMQSTGALDRKRSEQHRAWLWSLLREGLEARFLARADVSQKLPAVERSVIQQEITPTRGALTLLSLMES